MGDRESIVMLTPSKYNIDAWAQFERNLIKERTMAGLSAARARGRLGGRPKVLNADKQQSAVQLYEAKKSPGFI